MSKNQQPMANLIMYQPHRNRRELKKMPQDRLLGRRRTTPAVQVHNLSQQSIGGGSRPRSSWRLSYRNRVQNRGVQSSNQGEYRDQTTLDGRNLAAKDSDSFGDAFPKQPTLHSSIITFQNTGQMGQYIMQEKSEQIATAFKKSNASVALYAEHSLNQNSKEIPITERFHQRMINVNPSSLSKIA